jgi:hypothetical protein
MNKHILQTCLPSTPTPLKQRATTRAQTRKSKVCFILLESGVAISHLSFDVTIGLKKILKEIKTGMLVTRAVDGALHSRAMSPSYGQQSVQDP